jgi:hypothetical protein
MIRTSCSGLPGRVCLQFVSGDYLSHLARLTSMSSLFVVLSLLFAADDETRCALSGLLLAVLGLPGPVPCQIAVSILSA